jgi:hypothetical protein
MVIGFSSGLINVCVCVCRERLQSLVGQRVCAVTGSEPVAESAWESLLG